MHDVSHIVLRAIASRASSARSVPRWAWPPRGGRRGLALLSLGAILYNDEFRPGVYGAAIVYVVALAYFAIAGRHRLVLSPEEEFAMTKGEHAQHPEEVYAHTRMEGLEHPAPPDADPALCRRRKIRRRQKTPDRCLAAGRDDR